jgi:hypothetical protein
MATAYELQAANEAQFGDDPMMSVLRKKAQMLMAPLETANKQFAPQTTAPAPALRPLNQEEMARLQQPIIKPLGIDDNSDLVKFGNTDGADFLAKGMADAPALKPVRGMVGKMVDKGKEGAKTAAKAVTLGLITGGAAGGATSPAATSAAAATPSLMSDFKGFYNNLKDQYVGTPSTNLGVKTSNMFGNGGFGNFAGNLVDMKVNSSGAANMANNVVDSYEEKKRKRQLIAQQNLNQSY